MFMQTGFAMVETGFTRAKNAAHTMSMNFMVYPIGMLGYWVCGFALQMGGVAPVAALGGVAPLNDEVGDHPLREDVRALRDAGLLPGRRRLRRRRLRAVPLPDGLHGHRGDDPDRGHGRALEVVVVPGLRASSCRCSSTRSSATGCGAGAGSPTSARTSASATATSTSPAPRSCTWWAASRPSRARSCSGRASASSTRTASRSPSPATTSRWRSSGTFILAFGWFGFNPGSTLAGTDLRIAVVATNTMLAGTGGAHHRDALHDVEVREARPQHDGQRHAGRARGDHRALRLRDRARRRC